MTVSFINTLLSYLLVLIVFVAAIAVAVCIGVFCAKLIAKSKEKKAVTEVTEEATE